MTVIDNIKKTVLALGGCQKATALNSIEDAVNLFMTPQGREFAMRTGFPTIQVWRENAGAIFTMPWIYIDAGNVVASKCDCIAVGDTSLTVSVSGTEKLVHVIAMHGAEVKIDARNYAVVTLTLVGGTFELFNDGTCKISMEGK